MDTEQLAEMLNEAMAAGSSEFEVQEVQENVRGGSFFDVTHMDGRAFSVMVVEIEREEDE